MSAFLDAMRVALSGRSYPNCDLASRLVAKIEDPSERELAAKVVQVVRDWVDQSYKLEGRDPADVRREMQQAWPEPRDPDYNAVSSREAYERAWEDKRRNR